MEQSSAGLRKQFKNHETISIATLERMFASRVTAHVNDDDVAPHHNEARLSHAGEVLSRSVTFQFALDPNREQRILLEKCAGARRFTVNHHLARVKANLDARSAERGAPCESEESPELSTPALSWSAFSFTAEFNAWKNGESDDSSVNEDGS